MHWLHPTLKTLGSGCRNDVKAVIQGLTTKFVRDGLSVKNKTIVQAVTVCLQPHVAFIK